MGSRLGSSSSWVQGLKFRVYNEYIHGQPTVFVVLSSAMGSRLGSSSSWALGGGDRFASGLSSAGGGRLKSRAAEYSSSATSMRMTCTWGGSDSRDS